MKNWERFAKFTAVLGIVLFMVSIALTSVFDFHASTPETVRFYTFPDDELVGRYYPGWLDIGVILLEGFGSDQETMQSALTEFAQMGFSVFTFDFSGHGRSPGTLGYDNAQTPRLAEQVLAAKEEFKRLSGLPDERIVLLGHSLGARVALQAAAMDDDVAGIVLLGAQVNLSTNTQAEFFTGVSDADLAWVQALGPETPDTHILMISGEWDDILTPQAAGLLAGKLAGGEVEPNGEAVVTASGKQRKLVILPNLLHNYEVFSSEALNESVWWSLWLLDYGSVSYGIPGITKLRVWCWVVGFAGMVMALAGCTSWLKAKQPQEHTVSNIEINDMRRFLWGKGLLWLGAIPLGGLLSSVFFLLPVGLPTFNLIYVAFFGGYGILMLVLYRTGRMPGTQGQLPFAERVSFTRQGTRRALIAFLLVWVGMAAYARSGWFYVFPLNARLVWLVLFSLPTSLGFRIGICEMLMIAKAAPGKTGPQAAAMLIGILPFFLYAAFLASIGSLSGVVGSVQGLLILGLVLLLGGLLRQLTKVHWFTAVCQAVLLYSLVLPQGVLFN